MKDYLYIPKAHSTNVLLKEKLRHEKLPEFFAVRTAFQTAGKGQMGNSWESERGKNLMFSMVLYPHHVAIDKQFIVSQLVSVAIVNVLSNYIDDVVIKWPNDIYVGDKKLGGILIENNLRGSRIEYAVIGIGINVNQLVFRSNAPNPVSIIQIIQKKSSIKKIFLEITEQIRKTYSERNYLVVKDEYMSRLYRNQGMFPFRDSDKNQFIAQIIGVEEDGKLLLRDGNEEVSGFYFKEVEFVL